MENTIENIWKEGFMDDSFSVPEINDVSTLKSIYFVDKFKSKYKLNIIALMVTATIVLFAFILGGVPFVGLFMFLLFSSLAFLGKRELDDLNKINSVDNNFDYLKSFDVWLKKLLSRFSLIYKIWVPLLFIGFSLALLQTDLFIPFIGETLIERFSGDNSFYLIGNMPAYWLAGILFIAGLLSLVSTQFFKMEMKSIYGDLIKRLDDMLLELESLR